MIGVALVALNHAVAYRCDGVEDKAGPDCAFLNVVESFIASPDELIDVVYISDFVMLAPVVSEMHFGLFWRCVLPIASPADNKWHVPTVLAIQPQ